MTAEHVLDTGESQVLFNGRLMARVARESDLADFLERVRGSFPPPNPVLEFVHANGNKLYMGLSAIGNHLAFEDASGEPPYFSSVGQWSDDHADQVVEYQMSEEGPVTEIPLANTVSFEDLLRVATAFLTTGVRPTGLIRWKED